MKRALPFLIIAAVLAVAVVGAFLLKRSATETSNVAPVISATPGTVAASPAPAGATATSAEPGADPPHALGPADAPVTLEEFGDFECPPCGLLHPILKQMEHEFGPRIRIIFREFPLVPTHQHALAAARSAEAAGLQGKFWEMHDLIYENQQTWHEAFDVRPIFEGYATKIGLDVERFKRDIDSQVVQDRIFRDGKRGHVMGVKGTPTVFLNGQEVPFESLQTEKLRAVINTALASQH
jgi:protein-disulfide isomerase